MSFIFSKENCAIHRKQALSGIALILLLSVSGLMIATPTSKAQTQASPLPTYAFVAVSPNPAGVGQQATIEMWLGNPNPTASGPSGGRWQGFAIAITKPDGTNQNLGPFTADDASFAVTYFTPSTVGNYSIKFSFPGQHITGLATLGIPVNVYYAGSTYSTTLIVQQQAAATTPETPLPSSYWTRPINSQNSAWYTISGNWLSQGTNTFGSTNYNATGNFNAYTTGPNSPHILWTKPLEAGGLVGGEFGGTDVSNYFTGKSYEMEFTPNIVINGVLYYNAPTNPKEGYYAVDLRTGQTLWWQNSTGGAFQPFGGMVVGWEYPGLTLGQIYNYLSPNMEGSFPYLWSTDTNTWYMYDANTGNLILQMKNGLGPTDDSQLTVEGPNGELLDYIVGTGWIALWNSTQAIGTFGDYTPPIPLFSTNHWVWSPPIGAVMNWAKGVQWNVTEQTYPGEALVDVNSGVILTSTVTGVGSFLAPPLSPIATEVGYSATTGQQLWVQNVTLPSGPTTGYNYMMGPMANGIFTAYDAFKEQWYGFNAYTGQKIWGPTVADTDAWGSEPAPWQSNIAYGILYGFASDGVNAFNLTTGQLLWTFKGITSGGDFPGFSNYPFEQATMTVADGKLYLNTGVSHGDPLFRGAQLYCVDATTGKLLWNINTFGEGVMPISDGILVALNGYDNSLYGFGRGPSKTTINAPQIGVSTVTPITITGSITDISAGASQAAVAANFPNGLPCVSDASMTQFMEAVYMQQSMPTNVTGVPVTLYVLDSNHNYRSIGTTTTNAQGEYGLTWTPDITGNYTVIAVFGGTQSYYGSSASTYFYAGSPSATPAPTASPMSGLASNSTIMYVGIAIIVVILIIGAAILLMLSRKRP